MTADQERIVRELLGTLRDAYEGKRLPPLPALRKARAVLRLADAKPEGLTEPDQRLLDELEGFAKWGELVYPVTRIEPAMFAARRRAKRGAVSPVPATDWSD